MKETEGRFGGISWELRHLAAIPVWEGLLRGIGLEFSQKSRQHLFKANELLRDNPVLIYANHSSMEEDVALTVSMGLTYLTNTRRIIGPAAMKHYDYSRDRKNAMLLRLLKPLGGIEFLPMVQPETIDSNAAKYGKEEVEEMRTTLRTEMENIVSSPRTIFGITPEGTRSEDGKLIRVRLGIGYFESYDMYDRIRYLPVAIVLPKCSSQPKIEIGEPLSLAETDLDKNNLPADPKTRAQFVADFHMTRLAEMLPPEMRGVYA
jgi:hypothetical protein